MAKNRIELNCCITQTAKAFNTPRGLLISIPAAFNSYNTKTKQQSTLFVDVLSECPSAQHLAKGTVIHVIGSFYVDSYNGRVSLKINAQSIDIVQVERTQIVGKPIAEEPQNPFAAMVSETLL